MSELKTVRILDDRFGWGQALAVVTIALTIVGAWAFIVGRSFAATYFAHFGLGLFGLGVPPQLYALYSFTVIVSIWPILLLAFALAVVAIWAPFRFVRRCGAFLAKHFASWPAVLMIGVVLIAVIYVGGDLLARRSARNYVEKLIEHDFDGIPRVTIWANSDGAPDSLKTELESLSEGCHRLLVENDDALFLIRTERARDLNDPGGDFKVTAASRHPTVLVLPRSQIHAMRLLNRFESCTSQGARFSPEP